MNIIAQKDYSCSHTHKYEYVGWEGGWRLQAPPVCSTSKLEFLMPNFLNSTTIKSQCH